MLPINVLKGGRETYSSSNTIQPLSVRIRRALNTTSRLTVHTIITTRQLSSPRLFPLNILHIAPVGTVQRHGVPLSSHIISFDDVDLAVGRPVVSVRQPKRGPETAPEGRVQDVEDE